MSRFVWSHLWAGCAVGGCLAPFAGFLACGLLFNDIGGPLFWPLIGVFTGLLGAGIGGFVGALRGSTQARSETFFGDTDDG